MFALMHSTRLESLHLSIDPVTGLKAVIAIHNSRLGPALGGCRYLAYPDDESAVALDALSIDLYTGDAVLYKAGAAASFLLRDGKAAVYSGDTLPIGILGSVIPGYVDSKVGGSTRDVVTSLVILLTILIRPYGMFGREDIERI